MLIDLVTVSATILAGKQSGSKEELHLFGNLVSNIFNNTLVLKSYELKTLNNEHYKRGTE